MTNIVSIGRPSGPSVSTCGYCSLPGRRSETKTSHIAAGLEAIQLSSEVYQKMIDRGWRRSGTWCYKPNLRASCCPQYTIKLDILAFKPSKSQRKLVNRWNRFILCGKEVDSNDTDQERVGNSQGAKSTSKKNNPSFSLSLSTHASESEFITDTYPVHRFETRLEPSNYTPEKYALFQRYQTEIHHDSNNTSSGFRRFLVDSPLRKEPIPYTSPPPDHLPINYGSYHQLYKVDGQLIAMAVLDILPNCVSSVYFMYDNSWQDFSLGKLSALREASLAREMLEAGALGMSSLYMGFYIHSCPKMKYKGEYSPSYLSDPETYAWFPLKTCATLLDKHRYACFSRPEHSTDGPVNPEHDREGQYDPPVPTAHDLRAISIVNSIHGSRIQTTSFTMSLYWENKALRRELLCCVNGLGIELSKNVIFDF